MNILSMSQEDVVLALINRTMGDSGLEKRFVDFEYALQSSGVTDSVVQVTLKGKAVTSLGEPGRWSGEKTLLVRRARFQRQGNAINLRVPFNDFMSIEHVLKHLYTFHDIVVSNEELEYMTDTMTQFAALPETYLPKPGLIQCRFAENNLRFDHRDSEFTVDLYRDSRSSLPVALPLGTLGSSMSAEEA